MTTDNPTAPKGSGGPPNAVGGRGGTWPHFSYDATPLYRVCDWMREPNWNGIPTPDESEPAPPTDGATHVVHHMTCPVHEDQIAEFEATIEGLRDCARTLRGALTGLSDALHIEGGFGIKTAVDYALREADRTLATTQKPPAKETTP